MVSLVSTLGKLIREGGGGNVNFMSPANDIQIFFIIISYLVVSVSGPELFFLVL